MASAVQAVLTLKSLAGAVVGNALTESGLILVMPIATVYKKLTIFFKLISSLSSIALTVVNVIFVLVIHAKF
ncbi:MAG: hypothetical protein SPI63_02960 [Bulleidia sp.]|nr:hypothetical protein [Bulleidia sp.]